jgi:hypothetical protein
VRVVRSLAGIVLGFGLFYWAIRLLAAHGTELGLSIIGTVAAGCAAGYLAALIAGAHEFPHAATVGLGIVALGFASMRAAGVDRPGWYQIAIAGCGPISAMIGAAVRLLTKRR